MLYLICQCLPTDHDLTWVIFGTLDLNALSWHILDVPGPHLHFLAIDDVHLGFLDRLLINVKFMAATVRTNLIILLFFISCLFPTTFTADVRRPDLV